MPGDEARSIAERFAEDPRLPSSLCPLLPAAPRGTPSCPAKEFRGEKRRLGARRSVLAIFFFLSRRSSLPLPRGKSMEMGRRSNIDRRSSSHSIYVVHSVGESANCVRHRLVSAPTPSSTTRLSLPPPPYATLPPGLVHRLVLADKVTCRFCFGNGPGELRT